MRARAVLLAGALAALTALELGVGADVGQAAVNPTRSIRIITVPAVPHLRLELGGRIHTTDQRGATTLAPADLQRISHNLRAHRLLLAQQIRLLPNRRPDGSYFRIERWYSNTSGRAHNPPLFAALDFYRPVRFALVSRTGRPVSLDRLDSLQMKRIDGAVINLTRTQLERPVDLQASRVVPLNGLVSKALLYRIQRVSIGGNNLVNRAQQSFLPIKTAAVRVRLLFYSVRFRAKDTLFGFDIGSGIRLVYPNGRVETHRFHGHGEVALAALPRGTYHVSVVAPGLSPSSPVSVTRDNTAELKVLSYLDIAVVGVVFVTLLLGLALVRRPALRRRLSPRWQLRRRRAVRRSA
jgi:hypothetical protein